MSSKKKTGALNLKRVQVAEKSELVVNAVKAAASREGLTSFVFLFWEDGDAKTGSAITSLEAITPRQAVNLCLLGAEHAIQVDLKNAREKGYPPEYAAIMDAYLAAIVGASRDANQALLALNARRAPSRTAREGSA